MTPLLLRQKDRRAIPRSFRLVRNGPRFHRAVRMPDGTPSCTSVISVSRDTFSRTRSSDFSRQARVTLHTPHAALRPRVDGWCLPNLIVHFRPRHRVRRCLFHILQLPPEPLAKALIANHKRLLPLIQHFIDLRRNGTMSASIFRTAVGMVISWISRPSSRETVPQALASSPPGRREASRPLLKAPREDLAIL